MKEGFQMKRWIAGMVVSLVLILTLDASAEDFSSRFEKGTSSFGLQTGFGYTIDLPPGRERSDISFLFFFPNYQKNLTGMIGESFYRGAWFWHVEAGVAEALNRDGEYLLGISPLMAEYKFLSPERSWAPNILLGAGFAYTKWKDIAERELGTEFEFLLHAGAGIEFFQEGSRSYSINYRLFHVSNAGITRPNIGLNAHVLSLGMRF
jgi:lipid A 3-O-deacylase